MGRTGRKREGRIVMLMAEGKEEQTYNQSQYQKRNIHKTILNKSNSLHYYQNNARMVPRGLTPVCHKMHISVNQQYQPASKSKISVGQKNKITSTIGRKQSTRTKSDGFLNDEELSYWSMNQKVDEDEMLYLPDIPSPFISLKRKGAREQNSPKPNGKKSDIPRLSLSGWTPWQTRLQKTFKVPHSGATKDFVDLMEFMDVQKAVGDEDNYGLEMDAYLNQEDILPRGQSNRVGIGRYCTPQAAPSTSRLTEAGAERVRPKRKLSDSKNGEESGDDLPKKKKRKSIQLADFSSDEEAFNKESGDELPDCDIGDTSKSRDSSFQGNVGGANTDVCSENTVETSEKDVSGGESERSVIDSVCMDLNKWKTKKKVRAKRPKANRVKRTEVEKDERTDTDLNDATELIPKHIDTGIANNESHVIENGARTHTPVQDLVNRVSVREEIKAMDSASDVEYCAQNSFDTNEINPKFTAQFPIFTPESALSQYVPRKKRGEVKLEPERVQTPPSQKELVQTMEYLESADRLSPVDMLDLIDKWEKEKENTCVPSPPPVLDSSFAIMNSTQHRKVSVSEYPVKIKTSDVHVINDDIDLPMPVNAPSDQNELDHIRSMGFSERRNQSRSAAPTMIDDISADSDCERGLESVKISPIAREKSLQETILTLKELKQKIKAPDSASEVDLDDSSSVQYVSSRTGPKVDTTVSLDTESDTGTSTRNEHGQAESSLSILQKHGTNELAAAMKMPKKSEKKETMRNENSAVAILQSLGSSGLAQAIGDSRRQAPAREEHLQIDREKSNTDQADDAGSVLSVSSKSSSDRKSTHSMNDFATEMPEEDDIPERSLSKSSHSLQSDDSVSFLATVHNVSTLDNTVASHLKTLKPSCNSTPLPWSKSQSVTKTSDHDSFYYDNLDDSVFAAVQTPFMNRTPVQLSPRPGDTSQITFTQALACVHESSNSEGSQGFDPHQHSPKSNETESVDIGSDKSTSPVFHLPETTQPVSVVKRGNLFTEEEVQISDKSGDQIVSPNKTATSENSHVDEPKFDLGFDFSSDEDVIPPSPPASGTQPFSQKSFKTSNSLQRLKSFEGRKVAKAERPIVINNKDVEVSNGECEEDSQSLLHIAKPSTSRNSVKSSGLSGEEDSMQTEIFKDSPTAQLSRGINHRISSQISNQIKHNTDPPVAVVVPTLSQQHDKTFESTKDDKDDDAVGHDDNDYDPMMYDIPDFDDEFETHTFFTQETKPSEHQQENKSYEESSNFVDQTDVETIDPSAFVDGMDDAENDFVELGENVSDVENETSDDGGSSPVLTLSSKIKSPAQTDSDDDSFITERRQKRRAQILMSPDSPPCSQRELKRRSPEFKTPLAPPMSKLKRTNIGSDHDVTDDSPFVRKAKRKLKPIADDPFLSDDDDFQDETKWKNVKGPCGHMDEDSPIQRKVKKKKKKKRTGNMFIDEEAELSQSEDGSSDDSEGSDLDQMDDSFIYDQSQCSQQDPNARVNQHAMYLKSIRSPVVGSGRFKLKYDHNQDLDVFSQRPNPEEYSEYLEDSFCVDSDQDESEYLYDDGNDTLMMMPPLKAKKKQSKPVIKAKGRSRIVKTAESSSEEETDMTNQLNRTDLNKSKFHGSKNTGSRNRIKSSSSSVSDESLMKKGNIGANKIKSSTSSVGEEPDSPVVTQMAPLRERLRQKFELEASASKGHMIHNASSSFTLLKPTDNPTAHQPSFTSKRDTAEENVKPGFSLTMEGFSDSDDDFTISDLNITNINQTVHGFTSGAVKTKQDEAHRMDDRSHAKNQTNSISDAKNQVLPKKTSPQEISREERIRLAKLKQEGFRKKRLAQQTQNKLTSCVPGHEHKTAVAGSVRNVQASCLPAYATPPANAHKHDKPIILVDSKEISSSQEVLTELRFKHHMNAQIRSLGTCDYIVSNRMAVERKSMSDFTNGQNKAKLVNRIRTMLETFDRVAIIIERDRDKSKGTGNKSASCVSVMKSKYVEQTISWLSQVPNIKVFYTENQVETAAILHELNSQEQRKGSAIEVPVELSQGKEQMLRFYLSLPRMSYILALNFLHAFTNLKHFIHCPTTSIVNRFQLTKSRVEDIKAHLLREFDQQMIPMSKR